MPLNHRELNHDEAISFFLPPASLESTEITETASPLFFYGEAVSVISVLSSEAGGKKEVFQTQVPQLIYGQEAGLGHVGNDQAMAI